MWLTLIFLAGSVAAVYAIHGLFGRWVRADVLPGHRDQCGCWACNLHRMGDQKRRI